MFGFYHLKKIFRDLYKFSVLSWNRAIFIIGQGGNPIFIIYNDLNDLLSAFTKSMVIMSLKCVPGVTFNNPIGCIMTYIILGTGI